MLEIPKTPTDEVIMAAAMITATELSGWGDVKIGDIGMAAKDIASVTTGYRQDGYELAKNLEARKCWDINAQMVEVLDGHSHEVEKRHNEWLKNWLITTKTKPPLEVGTHVKFHMGQETGVITGIYDHGPCKYLIKKDGCVDDGRFSIVWWDKAEVIEKK